MPATPPVCAQVPGVSVNEVGVAVPWLVIVTVVGLLPPGRRACPPYLLMVAQVAAFVVLSVLVHGFAPLTSFMTRVPAVLVFTELAMEAVNADSVPVSERARTTEPMMPPARMAGPAR